MYTKPRKSFERSVGVSRREEIPWHVSGGRFIPHRQLSSMESPITPTDITNSERPYDSILKSQLVSEPSSIFHFGGSRRLANKENSCFVPLELPPSSLTVSPMREISKTPFKVLDAPQLQDDFYLNVVDWGDSDILAVGLSSSIYLWSGRTGSVVHLADSSAGLVASVSWAPSGSLLAVGSTSGQVQLFDINKERSVRDLPGHEGRVGSLSWNNWLLSSGSRDRHIIHRDLRGKDCIAKLSAHSQEVCGLKWSPQGEYLASGGNDNKLVVWSSHSISPVAKYDQHTAAVKAIAWSPHQHGLLASGGGTADRTIRIWDVLNNSNLVSVDSESQVCSLAFSRNYNELVSTHGYSQNQVHIWKCPDMTKSATLMGHTSRVLYLALSPDSQTIVTGAGDETLRFWKVFQSSKTKVLGACNLFPSLSEIR